MVVVIRLHLLEVVVILLIMMVVTYWDVGLSIIQMIVYLEPTV